MEAEVPSVLPAVVLTAVGREVPDMTCLLKARGWGLGRRTGGRGRARIGTRLLALSFGSLASWGTYSP